MVVNSHLTTIKEEKGLYSKAYLPRTQNKQPVTVNDSVQAVGNYEHCATLEFFSDCFLNKSISSYINSCCCLIKNKYLRPSQQSTSQTQQLALSDTKIFTRFRNLRQ
jgi:hypothetical protein